MILFYFINHKDGLILPIVYPIMQNKTKYNTMFIQTLLFY